MIAKIKYGVIHMPKGEEWLLLTDSDCRAFATVWTTGDHKFFQWESPAGTTITIRLSDVSAFEVFPQ